MNGKNLLGEKNIIITQDIKKHYVLNKNYFGTNNVLVKAVDGISLQIKKR